MMNSPTGAITTQHHSTNAVATNAVATNARAFDPDRIRGDFPILRQKINGHPLVYLVSAATSQKPQAVIDAMQHYYTADNANIHRGVHTLSIRATDAYEGARAKVQQFIGAQRPEEIIFVRSATEAVNLVANTWGRANLKPGDEVLITVMEHHSNIVPWQMICEQTGAVLKVAPINDNGELLLDEFEKLLKPGKTRIVAAAHVSNALGTINPVREMVRLAHQYGAIILICGAQAAPHMAVNVCSIGCDFYIVSGHKMCGPTGIGALYGRYDILNAMPPYQGGGDMILSVTFEKTTYNCVPYKFEAGTPNIAGTIGLGAAVDYLRSIGMDTIAAWEHELLDYGTRVLRDIPGVRLIGTAKDKAGVLSFLVGDIHPHDVGTILDQQGIAIRTGHHCAQPVMNRFGVAATARASLAFYNTKQEIDALAVGIRKAIEVFGR